MYPKTNSNLRVLDTEYNGPNKTLITSKATFYELIVFFRNADSSNSPNIGFIFILLPDSSLMFEWERFAMLFLI